MEAQDIIFEQANKLNKIEIFDLLYKIKNSNIINLSINELFDIICNVYNDTTPLYQHGTYLDGVSDTVIKDATIISNDLSVSINGEIYDSEMIEITEEDVLTLSKDVKEKIKTYFSIAENNSGKYIFYFKNLPTSFCVYLFSGMIIPVNVILPKEYAHKTLISNYFYDTEKMIFYKINDNRTKCVVVDVKNKIVHNESYYKFTQLPMLNIVPSTEDVFVDNFSKVVNGIYKV